MLVLQIEAKIVRIPESQLCSFVDHFQGFEKVKTVRQLLGEKTGHILQSLMVEFTEETKYMKVSDVDGHLMINPQYLRQADIIDLYLDLIHELVHVKAIPTGKTAFR